MSQSKKAWTERWAKVRKQGFWRFVLLRGALGWGICTALLWSIAMWFLRPGFNIYFGLPVALILFSLGGIAWGTFVWWIGEWRFRKDGGNVG